MGTTLDYGATHAIAFPSKLLAQNGGKHIYNVLLTDDCDNGNFVKRGDFIDLDCYEEDAVTTFEGIVQKKAANGNWYIEVVDPGDALFVYMQPFGEEEWTRSFKNEKRWFNPADSYVRAYELAVGDVVEISEEGITGTPVPGAAVSITNKMATV